MMRINELLTENQIHDYQHGTIDSNHAPMTLIAMHELGASDQELETYFNSIKKEWSTQKLDISRTGKLDRNNYSEFYGQRSYFSRFVDFFCSELKHNGLTKTLEVYLPELASGPGKCCLPPYDKACLWS